MKILLYLGTHFVLQNTGSAYGAHFYRRVRAKGFHLMCFHFLTRPAGFSSLLTDNTQYLQSHRIIITHLKDFYKASFPSDPPSTFSLFSSLSLNVESRCSTAASFQVRGTQNNRHHFGGSLIFSKCHFRTLSLFFE